MDYSIHSTGIQSIARAAAILRYVSDNDDVRLTDISTALNLNINTAAGLVNTLKAEGYLLQNPFTKRISLGYEILRLSSTVHVTLSSICEPYLNRLREQTNETINLARFDQNGIIYIEKLESPLSVRISTKVGIKLPCFCTAIGKAILAFKDPEEVDEALKDESFPSHTCYTIHSKEDLLVELKRIRQEGLAYDREELEEGLICVAAPIFTALKDPIAGISISGPSFRMEKETLAKYSDIIKSTADMINEELACIPPSDIHKYMR